MGEQLAARLAEGLTQEPTISIRINPYKARLLGQSEPFADESGKAEAIKPAVAADPVPWCCGGFYLKERPNFTFDPLLHAGLYYVQEASSMFLDHVLRHLIHTPVQMLDLCAAPGGKTTCAMAALPTGSVLYSNEPVRNRAQILNENVLKFGHPDIIVTNAYPADYRKTGLSFDVILTDVPCSGEGMFRKDEGAIAEWNTAGVEKCWRLQRDIVETIWPCLRPGGLLIYSTCTFNAHENEENVAWIAQELGAEFVEIPTKKEWNIVGSLIDDHPVYRFLPGTARGEGLFMAVLRKKTSEREEAGEKRTERDFPISKVISHGPLPDIQKGKKSIPDASQALTINDMPFPTAELPYHDALAYLQGQSIVLPADTPKGFVAVTYKGLAIGLVKNLGNRANNLHPTPWRIRTTHLPSEETTIIHL